MESNAEYRFQDDKLAVTIITKQDAIFLELEDRMHGKRWGPSPLLALEVHNKPVRREDRLESYRIDRVEQVQNGVHVIVGDTFRGISVGLWVRLRQGELSVLLSPPEVYETKPQQFRLFAVDLLPNLMAAGPDGMLLMPLGTGTICYPKDKPKISDRFLIYLEQDRWELATLLPFCGAWDSEGGLAALAVQGDCDAQCRVATDGRDHGQIGFAFSLRRHWPDPVDYENREFLFTPIPPRADAVNFTAKRLRRHVIENLGKKTLKQRAEESPEVAYLLGAYSMKLFHAIENEGLEMVHMDKSDPVTFFNVLTFAEAREGLQRLHDAGIARIHTMSVGWNARGHDGLYPARFPVDERLGGEQGFRDLIAAGNALGYHMNMHDNFSMNIPHAPNYDPECLIHDMYGEPLVSGWWGGGIEYQSWGLALPHERLTGHIERVKSLGVHGAYYCDYMMRPLEVNYHPKHRGPRSHHARGQLRILQEGKRIFGAVATEYGILPVAVACDCIAAAGGRKGKPEWPVKALMDRTAPMWQLVFQGLTLLEQTGVKWESVMQAVLFGRHLRDEWSYRPVKHPALSDWRVRALKAQYDICVERFGYLQSEELVSYIETGDDIRQTVFSDGTEVTADFGKMELFVNGEFISRPSILSEESLEAVK